MIGALMSYGAALIPLAYLVLRRGRGRATKWLLIGLVLQATLFAVTWAYIWYCSRAGYKDTYMLYPLFPAMNIAALAYYLTCILALRGQGRRTQPLNIPTK